MKPYYVCFSLTCLHRTTDQSHTVIHILPFFTLHLPPQFLNPALSPFALGVYSIYAYLRFYFSRLSHSKLKIEAKEYVSPRNRLLQGQCHSISGNPRFHKMYSTYTLLTAKRKEGKRSPRSSRLITLFKKKVSSLLPRQL
jgi:hypothetical protein